MKHFKNIDLSIIQQQLLGCYHTTGPGRKPRNPLGILRALLIMRLKGIRSLRELTRILDVDPRIRRLCLIKVDEEAYPRSVISRFTHRVGADTLRLIIEEKGAWLLRRSGVSEVDAVLDASFLRAWSIRNPTDNQRGLSDPARATNQRNNFKLKNSKQANGLLSLTSQQALERLQSTLKRTH